MYRGNSKQRGSGNRSSSSYRGSRNSGGSRPTGNRNRNGRGGGKTQRIDVSRFINKAVVTTETTKFVPKHSFTDFNIVDALKKNIVEKGYVTPTAIQDQAIPHILQGSDLVGIANTGTGKTAAFLIPLINKVLLNQNEAVLIVVPTRELALQIDEEIKGFTKGMKLFSVTCVGGASIGRQISELSYFNSFVIGTPGRLKDLINRGNLNLSKFNTIVLDEADRMLDMGFINDMKFMIAKMPKVKHTLFFSATLSPEIEKLIKDFLHNPVSVSVKTKETSESVDQDVIRLKGANKIDVLHDLLIKKDFDKVLIFGRTKHGVERLANDLVTRGFKAESIHGDKNQARRQKALDLFKRDHVQVLVATDVAARGLDIAGVSHVINYDIPATYDDYVHRIGRTGRGDKSGIALTFVE